MSTEESIATRRPRRTIVAPDRFVISYTVTDDEKKDKVSFKTTKKSQYYQTTKMTLAEMQKYEEELDSILGPVDDGEEQEMEPGDENEEQIDAAGESVDGFIEPEPDARDPDGDWQPEEESDGEETPSEEYISDEEELSDASEDGDGENGEEEEEEEIEEEEEEEEEPEEDSTDDEESETTEEQRFSPGIAPMEGVVPTPALHSHLDAQVAAPHSAEGSTTSAEPKSSR
jgi:hypothetical protein